MKKMKLNAIEMARIEGGFDPATFTVPSNGPCAHLDDCGCAVSSDAKAAYTAHRNNADEAWGQ